MSTKSKAKKTNAPLWTKFVVAGLGGASGWMFIHPADVLKVRGQINTTAIKKSMPTMVRELVANEGYLALYSGLSAAITRQLTYTTLRLGLYDVFRGKVVDYNESQGRRGINIWQKLGTGLTAGAIAAGTCCPVEVALVRMQADGAEKNVALKRNYKNVFDAIFRVAREEGVANLWAGVRPTITRGMVVSCIQLGTYDQAKETLKDYMNFEEGVALHLSASVFSGYVYCVASLPLDICKTRMQNQQSNNLLYTSIPQTIKHMVTNEGFLSLWKGFGPYFARSGGHTITMFMCVEQYRKIVTRIYDKELQN